MKLDRKVSHSVVGTHPPSCRPGKFLPSLDTEKPRFARRNRIPREEPPNLKPANPGPKCPQSCSHFQRACNLRRVIGRRLGWRDWGQSRRVGRIAPAKWWASE